MYAKVNHIIASMRVVGHTSPYKAVDITGVTSWREIRSGERGGEISGGEFSGKQETDTVTVDAT